MEATLIAIYCSLGSTLDFYCFLAASVAVVLSSDVFGFF